uniref:EF-hand domain-containing protein n=1 Tax=Globisporangium ultimum (strain ATCC 200006 / CBS 805.95 / DAOM BR144) TaxID=431595 RepID=K3WQH7_GLOUD
MRTETSARGTGGSERDAPSASASNSTLSSSREKLHLKPQVVRIEVLGDEKVGKTSLICSLVSRHYSEKVPSVLLNVQIPAEESDENVIISITDTSSRVSDLMRAANATKRSDAILLVYDLTRPETFQRLRRWLDFIARHREVPVVLVANKKDVNVVTPEGSYANQVRQLVHTYPKKQLEPKCVKAIKRAFRLYNRDRNGILSRDELNEYQHDCFGMRLLTTEMDTMMEFLASAVPEGVAPNGNGIFLDGFKYLWQLFIDRHRPESCWQVLRSLGYNNELHLEIPPERIGLPPFDDDQAAQLTPQALEFITQLFRQFDANKDGNLREEEIDDIFSICEDEQAPWKTCSAIATPLLFKATLVDGKPALSLSSWLACWSFVAQENPSKLLETLFYLGYNDKLYPALELTKSRSLTREVNKIERNVVTCYLYGSPLAEKSTFVDAFVEKKSPAPMADPVDDANILRAINAVIDKDATRYLLVTQEITENEIEKKADVLCILFNPDEPESLTFAEEEFKRLPDSIPRVVIAYKAGGKAPAPAASKSLVDGDLATEAMLKQFPTAFLCDDETKVAEAITLLVRTALRPPKNARGKSGSGLGISLMKTLGVTVVCVTLCAGVLAVAKPDTARNFWNANVKPVIATARS